MMNGMLNSLYQGQYIYQDRYIHEASVSSYEFQGVFHGIAARPYGFFSVPNPNARQISVVDGTNTYILGYSDDRVLNDEPAEYNAKELLRDLQVGESCMFSNNQAIILHDQSIIIHNKFNQLLMDMNDVKLTVARDSIYDVGHDVKLTVARDSIYGVGRDEILTVARDSIYDVGHDEILTIENNKTDHIKNDYDVTTDNTYVSRVGTSFHKMSSSAYWFGNSSYGIYCSGGNVKVGAVDESGSTTVDWMAKYTELKNILDALVAHVANITTWANGHVHTPTGAGLPTTPPNTQFAPNPYFVSAYPAEVVTMKTGI